MKGGSSRQWRKKAMIQFSEEYLCISDVYRNTHTILLSLWLSSHLPKCIWKKQRQFLISYFGRNLNATFLFCLPLLLLACPSSIVELKLNGMGFLVSNSARHKPDVVLFSFNKMTILFPWTTSLVVLYSFADMLVGTAVESYVKSSVLQWMGNWCWLIVTSGDLAYLIFRGHLPLGTGLVEMREAAQR